MHFAQMGGGARYTKEVAGLNGGLNTWDPPALLDDRALPACENVYWNRGALRTRPALRITDETRETDTIVATFETVDGEYKIVLTVAFLLIYYKGKLILKEQNFRSYTTEQHAFFAEGKDGVVLMFFTWKYGDVGGRELWEITPDEEKVTVRPPTNVYEPIAFINGRGTIEITRGEVLMAEGLNLLSDRYRGFWTTDGKATWFCPPFKAGRGKFVAEYTHTDGEVYTFTAYLEGEDGAMIGVVYSEPQEIPGVGNVRFSVYPVGGECSFCDDVTRASVALPDVGFANNLLIRGVHTINNEDAIYGMSFSAWFGGASDSVGGGTRLFLGGHTKEGHIVRYSDVDDPLYFPENNFMYVGDPSQAVTAFGKQNGVLVIFKERELFGCEYAYKEVDETAFVNGETVDLTSTAYFPLTQLHSAVGCDLPRTVRLCGNRLVWANSNGAVYMLSALSAWSEKAVHCLSRVVEPSLRGKRADAAALYHGYYLLFFGEEVYLFDCENVTNNVSWYRWRLPPGHYFPQGRDDGMVLIAITERGLGVARFEEGTCDRSLDADSPIHSCVTTKPYSLGRAGVRGAVYALQLQLGCTGGAVDVSLYGDGGDVNPASYRVQTTLGDANDVVPVSVPCRQTRVRTLGVTVESDEPLVFTGLSMEYRIWKGV